MINEGTSIRVTGKLCYISLKLNNSKMNDKNLRERLIAAGNWFAKRYGFIFNGFSTGFTNSDIIDTTFHVKLNFSTLKKLWL